MPEREARGPNWQRALFDEYYHYVYAIVYRALLGRGTAEDVEECVADVFAQIILRYDTISPESLRAYIGTTARHKAINAGKALAVRDKHTVPLEETPLPDLPSPEDVDAHAEKADTAAILLREILALGEPDATILIQKYYYDCTSQEIADHLQMTPTAVRTRCRRALARLRSKLTALGIDAT